MVKGEIRRATRKVIGGANGEKTRKLKVIPKKILITFVDQFHTEKLEERKKAHGFEVLSLSGCVKW